MSDDKIRTVGGIVLKDWGEEQNTRTGTQSDYTYEGTYAECVDQREDLKAAGASVVVLRPTGTGWWTIRAEFPFGDNGIENVPTPSVHEIEISELSPSVWLNPVLRVKLDSTEAASDKYIAILARIVQDYEAGLYNTAANTTQSAALTAARADVATQIAAAGGDSTSQGYAQSAFDLVALRKVDTYLTYTSVYRRTITAASLETVDLVWDGVEMIWTTDEMIEFEDPPSSIILNLWDDSQWHKSRPQVVAAAGQKTQVIYTYKECRLASGLLYVAYGEADLLDS